MQKNTKKISLLLLVSFLVINLSFLSFPKKSLAYLGVEDTNVTDAATFAYYEMSGVSLGDIVVASDATAEEEVAGNIWDNFGKYLKDELLAGLAKKAALILVQKITDSIVDWINSGFQGQPAFVSDPGKFLLDTADQTVGDMILNNKDLNFLCAPFQAQVKIALGIEYGTGRFARNIGCTLTNVIDNVGNAIDSASVIINGKKVSSNSWENWLEVTQKPQNTPLGAFIIAKAELDSQIKFNKESKTLELAWGQGALSFNKCDKVTYAADGKTEIGRESVSGSASNIDTTSKDPDEYIKVENCITKTPGSTITQMLGFKATSDARMNEIMAATADGIDSIIGALMNSAIDAAIEKIQTGILDSSSNGPAAKSYKDFLANVDQQAWQRYTNGMNLITSGNLTSSAQTLGIGINPPSYLSGSSTGSTTTSINTIGGIGGVGGGGALDQARNNAIVLLNSLSASESAYQNNYLIAQKVLVSGRAAFATSSLCNINYNRASSVLRSTLITANVIKNIDGIQDSNRTSANLPWNLPFVSTGLLNSRANQAILSTASINVNSATSISDLQTAMTPVNSTTFNTDPQYQIVTSLKTWLTGNKNLYDSIICPIDLTNVLQINTP